MSLRKNILKSFILFTVILALGSCNTSKTTLPYLSDIATIDEGVIPEMENYKAVIKPDDELLITVTSSVQGAAAAYNTIMPGYSYSPAGESLNYRQLAYTVNADGDIDMPVIGNLHVAGLTVQQLQDKVTEIIRKDISDAIVRVELINFYVYVAGEVTNPQQIKVETSRFSVLDALALAGDLTQYGERSNVLLIRNENGQRVFKHLDLNSSEILTSPYFYLRQNDYIYVQPNKIKQSNSRYDQQNAYKLQVTSTIVSVASVIASLVIALALR